MKIDSRCLRRFLGGKVGKAIGKKAIGLLLDQSNKTNSDITEVALGFMSHEDLETPEKDSAEILVKVVIKRISE
jgi:hypothetical protein